MAAALATGVAAPSASAIEVNSLADPGNGNCNDGVCTLREAIALAGTTLTTPDTITFKAGLSGTITIANTSASSGQFEIYSPMTIQGPGSGQITINASPGIQPPVRAFYTYSEGVTISGLTITGGRGRAYGSGTRKQGGAIYSYGSGLTLEDVVITDSDSVSRGGAIFSNRTNLTVKSSVITGGCKATSDGGGIDSVADAGSHPSSLSVIDSTISGCESGQTGGGINAAGGSGPVSIERSTISGNGAFFNAGGVNLGNITGAATISDSTIAGNSTAYTAGGLMVGNIPAGTTIRNTTVANNTGDFGGVTLTGSSQGVTISSSVLADNNQMNGTPGADLNETSARALPVVLTNTLVEGLKSGMAIEQNPAGASLIGVDPQLSPLADNGGPTKTMLIAESSPAVDAGVANGLATDQRGLPRTSNGPGANGAGSDGTDMGAVELQLDKSVDGAAVNASPVQKVKGKSVAIVVEAGAAEAVSLNGTGSITLKKKKGKGGKGKRELRANKPIALGAVTGNAPAGGTAKLTLTPSKSAGKKLAKQLSKGGKANATITVVLTDALGNTTSKSVQVKLKGKKKRKR
ncbi:MAG: choice-of-anchor Q domain-containing protein [Solirubrobacterales bacterium]